MLRYGRGDVAVVDGAPVPVEHLTGVATASA